MRLENKVILVTAPKSAVCWELVQACAQEDGIVYMAVPDQQQGGEKAQAATGRGMWVKSVYLDTRKEETIAELVRSVSAEEGRIDVLVNYFGADAADWDADLEHTSFERFMTVLRRNLAGVYLASQAAMEPMRATGGGSIINLPATENQKKNLSGICYEALRSAVHCLTIELARQGERSRIRCNAILPGVPEGSRTYRSYSPEYRPLHLRNPSVRRLGTPQEIAETAVYLASSDSAYTTGQLIETGAGFPLPSPSDRRFAEEARLM